MDHPLPERALQHEIEPCPLHIPMACGAVGGSEDVISDEMATAHPVHAWPIVGLTACQSKPISAHVGSLISHGNGSDWTPPRVRPVLTCQIAT